METVMVMQKKLIISKKGEIFLFLVFLFILCGFYIITSPCLRFSLSPTPGLLKTNSKHPLIIILNGKSPCLSCTDGKYIYSNRNRKNILFVFTKNYTKNDIENFIDVFDIKGEIAFADNNVESFLERFFKCKVKKKIDMNNLLIESNNISFL